MSNQLPFPNAEVDAALESPEADAPLSVAHTILERPQMVFRPFGVDDQGNKVADVSGTLVLSSLQYMESYLERAHGTEAASNAVAQLCRLLNERIADSAYHVTEDLLRNQWNSYSYEFLSYVREFCKQLSGDPQFHFNMGLTKGISPVFRSLARPYSCGQFAELAIYWAQRYTQGTVECEVSEVTDHSMHYRLRFTDHTLRQFGPYLKACAHQVCASTKGRMIATPSLIHGGPAAIVTDLHCIVNGDPWCEWEVRWQADSLPSHGAWWGLVPALIAGLYLTLAHPSIPAWEVWLLVLAPASLALLINWYRHRTVMGQRELLIREQMQFADARYEELRDAYVEQEQTRAELRRTVSHLTALHRAGLSFNSTLDREALVHTTLETLTKDLHYDRAMISFYDPGRHLLHQAQILGVSDDIADLVRQRELHLTDPESFPASALREGKPLLIHDIRTIWDRIHPINRLLAEKTRATSFIWIPLLVNERLVGTLMVDRTAPGSLTQDDVALMVTVGNQIAIALDNAAAYEKIAELNAGLEAKVRERTHELERADRIRSQFLSHVSHELHTPLTSVKGFVENLLDGLTGPLNAKQERYLGRILDNVDRLIRMINDLLDRTRVETGQLSLVPAEIALEHCLSDVIDQLRPLAAEKEQRLTATFPSTPSIVWADRDRLIQIVTNLIHNAIKFTPAHGQIDITVSQHQTLATILIRDTGPGIAPEAIGTIFDPFFRTAQGRRSGARGLGLGLSIVKTLVELHHGQITVDSRPDEGTAFSVSLPLIPAAPVTAGRLVSSARRLLIVDDDPDIRQLLTDRLQAEGFLVDTATDGPQALEAMEDARLSGVLLDIGIPQIDGLEVLQRVRKRNQQIPIVMVTASGAKELAIRSISLGAQAYLLKPFDLQELHQVIGSWFAHA